jgi:D-glucuronyl C5-epimerase C-terminus
MRRGQLAATTACLVLAWLWCASGALAARVTVLGPGGRTRVLDVPYLTARTPGSARARPAPARATAARAARKRRRRPSKTMLTELAALHERGAIATAAYRGYVGQWRAALRTERHLRGARRAELTGVVETLHDIAVDGKLTPSRLPAMFLTLARNRQWWSRGPLLSTGQRVEFSGSQLVWEYYPPYGIQLQELASFGVADGLYTAGPADYPKLESLLAELVPLAVRRAGGLAWEYYFPFDGGSPPWISAMAQGTAIEALTRAYLATGENGYLRTAHAALAPLNAAPPAGVGEPAPHGRRFLQYSFAPGTDIINAFLQTLIGLYDYAHDSGDAKAQRLFTAGDAEAERELPAFNTGAWSLYQPGVPDSLSYHELVTGFLQQLCARTAASVYCSTASDFEADLKTPPALHQLTLKVRRDKPFTLRFSLSKPSHVGVVVSRGSRTVFLTSANFAYGVVSFAIPKLPGKGLYEVRLAATDLAGNFSRTVGSLRVH